MLPGVLGKRQIRAQVDEVRLPNRQASSLIILVNEIISNAVKHGGDAIELTLRREPGDMLRLVIMDNGPGFPPDFNPDTAANTGLELIESMARWDLRGDVRYENRPEGGAKVMVIFPLPVQEAFQESAGSASARNLA